MLCCDTVNEIEEKLALEAQNRLLTSYKPQSATSTPVRRGRRAIDDDE
jgi:hypothetical protein